MANPSIYAAFERMWQHIIAAIGNKAEKADLNAHTSNANIHITSAERANWNEAKTRADNAYALAESKAVTSDWNQIDESAPDYIKNKPFGETTVIGEALYWNGNPKGRPTFEDQSSNLFVQVSEATPSLTQLYNGGVMIFYGGGYREFSERDIVGEQTDTIIGVGSHIPFVRIVLEETDGIPKGTYFYYAPGDAELEREPYHVETLVVNGFDQYEGIDIKTIDPKYLPANVATQEYVDETISSIPTPDVSGQIGEHNTSTTAHQDIRNQINSIKVPTKISELTNDNGYISSYTETDPTVPAWAKAASKPTYTAAEVGAVTEAQVTTMINNALGVIENGAY